MPLRFIVRRAGVVIGTTRRRQSFLTTLIPAYRLASQLIEMERPDLIHVHFALPSGLVAYQLSRRFNIPYVLTVHGSDIPGYNPDRFTWSHRIAGPFWRRVVKGAAVVTSPSEFLARLLRQHLEDSRPHPPQRL